MTGTTAGSPSLGRYARRLFRRARSCLHHAPVRGGQSTGRDRRLRRRRQVRSLVWEEFHGGGHGLAIRKEAGEAFLYCVTSKNRRVAKRRFTATWCGPSGILRKRLSIRNPINTVRPTWRLLPMAASMSAMRAPASIIDKDARWVRTWGGAGSEPGTAVPARTFVRRPARTHCGVVVADRADARLQYFSADGKRVGFTSRFASPLLLKHSERHPARPRSART